MRPALTRTPLAVVEVPPRFRVVTGPWHGTPDARTIVLAPSRAFGDGRHETTQMCLQALAVFAPRTRFRMFDVGSGTGILSIAGAKLGGEALGVDIDVKANAIAAENAHLNGLHTAVAFDTVWPDERFEVVIANMLRDVLITLAADIVRRLASGGMLVLSGLVSTDVPAIVACYAPKLDGRRPEIFERGPWRTLVWRAPRPVVS